MTAHPPEPTVKWVLFGWRGRIGRQSYFLGAALMLVAQIYIMINLVQADRNDDTQMAAWGFFIIAFWFVSGWAVLAMTVKRLHDLNYSAVMAACLFIPMLNMLFVAAMMVVPGSQETNKHGPPPFPEKQLK